ncbi:hypothetical protein PG995_008463 [Apiospora arundinis]
MELADLQRRHDALETQLNTSVIPDARDFVPTAELEEAQAKLADCERAKSAAELFLTQEQAPRVRGDERIVELEEDTAIHKAKAGNLKKDLEMAKQDHMRELQAARDEHQREMSQQQSKQNDWQNSLQESESNLSTLRKERDTLQNQLSALQKQHQELGAAQSQMGRDRDDVQMDLDNAQLEPEEYKLHDESQQCEILEQRGTIEKLNDTVANYEGQVVAMTKDWNDMKGMHDNVSGLLTKANPDIGTRDIQAQEAEAKIKALNSTSQGLSTQYNELYTEHELLKQDTDTLRRRNAVLEAEALQTKTDLKQSKEALNQVQTDLEKNTNAM